MNKNYLSIDKDDSISFIVNKSEFIGYAFYVETVEEAESRILEIREKHKDATHNCYAYIIGQDRLIQKYSDDGEPSGTAGIPMLEVLKKMGITNVLVIATRYFGGILLGAGGLVRAYTKTVVSAVEKAVIVEKQLFYNVSITVDYIYWGKIENHLKNLGLEIIEIEYFEKVNINIFVNKNEYERLEKLIVNETSNNCLVVINDELFKSVFLEDHK